MKYQCPCCGYYTLVMPAKDDYGYICPVCFWENDRFAKSDHEKSACNHGLTLAEARNNFEKLGACEEAMVKNVRMPKDDECRKAVIIGASAEALHTIRKAHRHGIFVTALDGNPEAEGLKAADEPLVVDISDPQAVIEAVAQKDPEFVLTVPIGRYLTTVGAVNDALTLPGISEEMAVLCTDKLKFHEALYKDGLRNCHCYEVSGQGQEMQQISFPAILKPRYGSGSRGIHFVNDQEELYAAIETLQGEEYVLEECIEGEEYGIDGAVIEGQFHLILLRKKENTPLPFRQAVGYYSVQQTEAFWQQVYAYMEKVIACLGLQECLFHADIIKSQSGPFVIELSARPSGHNLHNLFTPLCTGVDMAEEYMKYRLGEPYSFVPKETRSMLIHYFDMEGKVGYVPDQEEVQQAAGGSLVEWNCSIRKGEVLAPVSDGHSVMGRGYFILEAEEKELAQKAKAIKALFFK